MINEKEILERLQNGDIMSLELLYKAYGTPIFSYAIALTKSKELAEDAVTDTFIAVFEYVQKEKKVKNLRALVYAVCRNKAYDELRYRSRMQSLPEDDIISDNAFPMDEKLAVRMAVDKLPSPEKEIVLLYCVHELKHKEVAEILNLPEGTVRWKYRNAIKALKKSLGGNHE